MTDEALAVAEAPLAKTWPELIDRAMRTVFGGVDWNATRRWAWHATLMLAAAYAQHDPDLAWLTPALVPLAGISTNPGPTK